MESEPIEITSIGGVEADKNWQYTDKQGHTHFYSEGENLPTLRWKSDLYGCDDCGDEHDDGYWECPNCGEEIKPGTRPVPPGRKFIYGPVSYYLNNEEIGREEFDELRKAPRE